MSYVGTAPQSGQILFDTGDNGLQDYGTLEGDVRGTLKETVVSGLAGFPFSGAPSSGDLVVFDGSQWNYTSSMADTHELLSSTHSDTTPGAVQRGDLVYGSGASASWNRLALGGQGQVIYSDGTDVVYTQLGQNTPFENGTAAAPSVTFDGDLDTGFSAQGSNEVIGSAGGSAVLGFSSAASGVRHYGGFMVRVRGVGVTDDIENDDYILSATAAPITLSLPSSPEQGRKYIVKDGDGVVNGGNRITIDGNGNNIDGNSTIQVRRRYASFTLVYNGTQWNVI